MLPLKHRMLRNGAYLTRECRNALGMRFTFILESNLYCYLLHLLQTPRSVFQDGSKLIASLDETKERTNNYPYQLAVG